MKRKKYVKQLMGLGVPRNRANLMAYCCQRTGQSYADDYRRRSPWLRVSQEAHKAAVSMRMVDGYFCSGLARAAAAVEKLRAALVVHHVRPITPDNLEGGDILVVTRQEHEALHGYSAKICLTDELETAGGGQE